MAEPVPTPVFDTAAARADGVPDATIAAFLAPKLNFDLAAAKKDGVTDSAIVDFLSPPVAPPKAEEPPPKATMGDDWQRGLERTRSDFGAMGAAVSGARLRDIEAAKAKADRGEYLSPMERGQASQHEEAKANAQRHLAEGVAQSVGGRKRAEALPISPGYKAFQEAQAGSPGDVVKAFWKAPGEILTSMLVEGAPAMLPALAGAVAAGPAGGAAIGAAQGFGQSYASAVVDGLAKRGIDVNDKAAMAAALADPKIADEIRAEAAKGAIPQAVAGGAGMAVGGLTLAPARLAARPVAQQAVNIPAQMGLQGAISAGGEAGEKIARGEDVHGGSTVGAFIGGAAQGPLDVAAFGAHRGFSAANDARLRRRTPEEAAKPVMDAATTDDAIAAAQRVVAEGVPVDISEITRSAEYGSTTEQQQGKLLQLFGGLNKGEVIQAGDGSYHYKTGPDDAAQTIPLKVWNERDAKAEGAEPTISPRLAEAQRDAFGKMGIDVVYFENDARIPFDGAVDPQNPNTIFLSNDPTRNVDQVGAHEVGHVLESTTMPDGRRLGDVFHDLIHESLTSEGWRRANELFGKTAPDRANFPNTPEGQSAHADAIITHLVREMGAETMAELPKFQTFMPKVIEEVQSRYGADVAKGVLQKLLEGIRTAMTRLREFYFRPDELAEYGQPQIEAQKWLTNLGELHDVGAKMYAVKFGEQAERESATLSTMRDKAQRDRFLANFNRAGEEVPPPSAPEGFAAQRPDEAAKPVAEAAAAPATPEVPEAPRPPGPMSDPAAYAEAASRAATLRRWLGDLDGERRSSAPASPQATLLKQTEAAILAKVNGVEARLTQTQAERLAAVRSQIDALHNPEGDSPGMAKVRAALEAEQAKMAQAASIGSAATPIRSETVGNGREVVTDLVNTGRIQAVMPEARPELATPAGAPIPAPAVEAVRETPAPAVALPSDAVASAYQAKVRAERERLWAEEMPRRKRGGGTTQQGLASASVENERMVTDSARDKVMREEIGEDAVMDALERGLTDDQIFHIARFYRPEHGKTPQESFREAVDRYAALEHEQAMREEAAGLFDPGYDPLKVSNPELDGIERAYRLMEEANARERAASEAPFESGQDDGNGRANPPEVPERQDRSKEGGQPSELGAVSREADELGGPQFSPKETEPRGPTLLDTREATANELDARQRVRDKQEAEARMRGRKGGKSGQEAADDLPLFGGDRQKTLFSPKSDKPFYSALTRAVENLKVTKAPPGQWEATIRNLPGVKPEERAWVGLDDWLRAQAKPVTKEEVLDYLRANEVQVQEVAKGGPPEPELHSLLREHGKLLDQINTPEDVTNARQFNAQFRETTKGMSEADVVKMAREVRETAPPAPTKFSTYTLPGGKNYRELLLTLPEKEGERGPKGWGDTDGRTNDSANFRGGHWDEPNVLAHVRFDDRTGPNGEKILHVAEVQSDWHQKGRKEGYKGPRDEQALSEAANRFENARQPAMDMLKRNDNLGFDTTREARTAIANDRIDNWEYNSPEDRAIAQEFHDAFKEAQRLQRQANSAIPDAPFKTTWPEIAFKRMVRFASEHGYDRLSWDTGETNAARYDLSKQVNSIDVSPRTDARTGEKTKSVTINMNDQKTIRLGIDKDGVVDNTNGLPDAKGKPLADVVGKEMADKIMSSGWETIRGADLKIGGEGMKAFYDKQLPIIANKLGKKFGAKVEQSELPAPHPADVDRFEVVQRDRGFRIIDHDTASREYVGPSYATRAEAEGAVPQAPTQATPVHSIEITPAMRDSVMQGQALFSPKQTETPEFKRWFGDSKVVDTKGKPQAVFHGTTGDFSAFDATRANPESDLGAGFYFTNAPRDVEKNYAGFGPDLTNKIEREAERIAGETDREYNDPDVVKEARERFAVHEGATMPVYLKMDNPVEIGGKKETRLDYEEHRDEDGEPTGEETGKLVDFIVNLRNITDEFHEGRVDDAVSRIVEEAMDYGEVPASRLMKILKDDEHFGYYSDDNGTLVSNEIVRRAFEATGFDGYIDRTANQKFGSERESGKKMSGVDKGTVHYVAFEPTQIKSAIGNSGTFDPANPDIRMSPRQDSTLNPKRAYSAADLKTEAEVFDKPSDEGLLDRLRGKTENLPERTVIATLDRFYGVKADDPAGYMALRLSNNAAGATEAFMSHGTLKFDGATYDWKERTGGVKALVSALGAEAHDFMKWIAGNRAEQLKAEGRENLMSDENIRDLKARNRGTLTEPYTLANGKTTMSREAAYLDALNRYHEINKNVMDLDVESGLITRKYADDLLKNRFYVPFYRVDPSAGEQFVAPGSSSASVKQSFGKKLKGGTDKLSGDLWENAVSNWSHQIEAALKNKNTIQVLKTAETQGAAVKLTPQEALHLSDKEQKATTVWVMENGEKQYYRIEDKGLFAAVSVLEPAVNIPVLTPILKGFKQLLQTGVTMNPAFAVRNMTRDTQQVLATTPISWNVAGNLATGFRENNAGRAIENLGRAMAFKELKDDGMSDTALSALAGGGLMRFGDVTDTGVRQSKIGDMLRTPEGVQDFWEGLRVAAGAYRKVMAQSEDVTRIALYKQLREQGLPHDFAAFSAKDIADFTLNGASALVRTITSMSAFTNARMQGLYKVGRATADADGNVALAVGTRVGVGIAKRVALVTVAGVLTNLALDALYADDPDYKKRDEFDRNSNYWFKIGKTEFRIPMGFEVGAVSRLGAIFAESFYDKEMTVNRAFRNFWSIAINNLSLDPTPTAIKPVIDVAVNRTAAGGGPIVGKGMEHLQADQRYTINSTLGARGLSSVLNAAIRATPGSSIDGPSPLQLDYMVRAYAGWLGTTSVQMADTVARSFTSEPVRPAEDRLAYWSGGFASSEPRSSSRYVNMLYEQADGIEKAYSTYREMIAQGRAAEAQRFFQDNRETIQKHGLVSGLMRLEGNLNRQIRLVENNPSATPEQKKIQIQAIQATKNRAAQQAFEVR